MKKIFLRVAPLIATAVLLTLFASPVFATGAHLWFYSVDPATLSGYPPLVNPQPNDPNYVGDDSDPWLKESIVPTNGDWETPFSMWLGNADPHDTSYDTMILISYNDAAFAAIENIKITGPIGANQFILLAVNPADFPLPPHGISNSAEWVGYVAAPLGDIASGNYVEFEVDIKLKADADVSGAKLHFDAIGWSTEEHSLELDTYDINSPYSHDSTFVVPEATTVLAVTSSMAALGAFAYKRKKQ